MAFASVDLWREQRKFLAIFLRTVGAAKVSPNKKACEELIKKHAEKFVQVSYRKKNGLLEIVVNTEAMF